LQRQRHRRKHRQKLVGWQRTYFPPIAKYAMDGHPRGCGGRRESNDGEAVK
jgi:hypothetical protein